MMWATVRRRAAACGGRPASSGSRRGFQGLKWLHLHRDVTPPIPNSPEAGVIESFVAKVGDTVEPGTKIAIISKSAEASHVSPSEKFPSKPAPQPSSPAEKAKEETVEPKAETSPPKEKPKAPSPPPSPSGRTTSAKEPQLPPKERERRSAILGMHSIVSRPMVVGKEILPRPMMYIALTYDHRLIDGREAVFFLRRIKDVVEDPRRLLLDV
ncbi:hypothetical protein ACFE04_002424 [Oxalis oulophora]